MAKFSKEDRLRNTVCRGLEHLQKHLDYGQRSVVNKLKTLGTTVSTSSLSNIKNGKQVGITALGTAAKGMLVLIQRELDMEFDVEKQDFKPLHTPNWVADPISEKQSGGSELPPFRLHVDGRVSVKQKTDFIAEARHEVIEVGVRLNSFASYFVSQNEQAYTTHIVRLLKKGVTIKAYLLDPESPEARVYFEDRAKVQTFEKDALGEIKKVIDRLKVLAVGFEAMKFAGSFEIYLYKHIPYCLFFAVDGALESGKMMVSPYLYGVRRANCPVMELTRIDQPVLFRTYWESMQLFMDGAQKLIVPDSAGT